MTMKVYSKLTDKKIQGVNLAAEMTIGEYLEFLPEILRRNEYQRKKVSSSGKIYELLRSDLVSGCVMPPIILATTHESEKALEDHIRNVLDNDKDEDSWNSILKIVETAISNKQMIILDGLQRSLTLLGIYESDPDLFHMSKDEFASRTIRIEIYAGLSKPGILYRMLTLNTGQTPMSFRHQLEILYFDFIDNSDLPDGISVVKETDESRARGDCRFKFSDVIDMFYAYTTGQALPYKRTSLISELKELNFLEGFAATKDVDDMKQLLILYNRFMQKVSELSGDWKYNSASEEDGQVERPFAKNINSALSRTQPMTGFGAECSRLKEKGIIQDFGQISDKIDMLEFSTDVNASLDGLIMSLDQIGQRAKKIGDAQRLYFQLVFRALFIPDTENTHDLSRCWIKALQDYEVLYV